MKKTYIIFTLLISAISFTGCATSPVASAKKASINSVKIEPRVDSKAMRFGKIQEGTLTAALTALTLDALKSKQLTEMTALMHEKGIDVPQMVRERFTAAVTNSAELTLDQNSGAGTFVLRLHQHGFDDAGFSLSKKIPFLVLVAELQDAKGKKVWSGGGTTLINPKNVGASWSEYHADPERLRRDWEAQIDFAVHALLRLK